MQFSAAFLCADAFTASEEGGYQNAPSDSGNFIGDLLVGTNCGISAPILLAWRQRQNPGATITPEDMRALTDIEAQTIRWTWFWEPINGDALPAGISLSVYDEAVNAGPGTAVMQLQASIGATQDGIPGPETIAAAHSASAADVLAALIAHQASAYAAAGGAVSGRTAEKLASIAS